MIITCTVLSKLHTKKNCKNITLEFNKVSDKYAFKKEAVSSINLNKTYPYGIFHWIGHTHIKLFKLIPVCRLHPSLK